MRGGVASSSPQQSGTPAPYLLIKTLSLKPDTAVTPRQIIPFELACQLVFLSDYLAIIS